MDERMKLKTISTINKIIFIALATSFAFAIIAQWIY
jgi:hypothetical protein